MWRFAKVELRSGERNKSFGITKSDRTIEEKLVNFG
jgi:hypothetical protein